MEEDAERLCGPRHGQLTERDGHRWGRTPDRLDFHGGTIPVRRPRVRGGNGELALPSWEAARPEGWLCKCAMTLMLLNITTRKFGRAVRLPEGDVPTELGDSRSKSAVSRRFVELLSARVVEWMSSDPSQLDLLAIQIEGLHIREDLMLIAAVGIDREGGKHPLPLWNARRRIPRRASAARQPDRSRPRSRGLSSLHRRRSEDADEGDPPDLWPAHSDPTLSNLLCRVPITDTVAPGKNVFLMIRSFASRDQVAIAPPRTDRKPVRRGRDNFEIPGVRGVFAHMSSGKQITRRFSDNRISSAT